MKKNYPSLTSNKFSSFLLFVFAFFFTHLSFGQVTFRASSSNSANSGNLTINKPIGVIAGDLMIVNISQRNTTNTNALSNSTLGGWTLVAGADLSGGAGSPVWGTILYKIAGGSEPASYTFANDADNNGVIGSIAAFSGVDNTTPFDVASGTYSVQGSQTGVVATTKTTISTETAIIMLATAPNINSNFTNGNWSTTSPGALTELYDDSFNRGTVGAAWAIKTSAGPTGAGSATLGTAQKNGGILLALKPAAPTYSSLSTTSGCTGTSLIINGANLTNATSVTIGGTPVSITANTATSVTVTVGTTSGQVVVTTPRGTTNSGATNFTANILPTITLSSGAGTNSQTICLGNAISSFTHTIGGSATGATTSGLPSGVNGNLIGSTYTISGTPSVSGTFNYTITTSGGSCSPATATGTITVNTIPTIATTPSPANAATNVCYSGTGAVSSVTWTAVAGASSYDVYFGAGSLPGSVTSNVITNSYSTGTLTANTTYYWQVVAKNGCGDAVGSSTWTFTTNGVPCGYCTTLHSASCSGTTTTNVTFNTINNNSTCGNTNGTSYTNYATIGSPATTVFRTFTYNLSVTVSASAIASAWIDYNANGIFEATEWTQVFTTGTTGTVSITIPGTATIGSTVLRIRTRNAGNPNGSGDSCTSFASGETEDYKITILAPTPCAAPTAQPTSLVLTPTNAGFNGTFTAASPAPDNYIVVANTTGITPTPSNGTTYTIGGTMGAGNIVTAITSGTSFSTQFLSGSTFYHIYIYSMNDLCVGGPLYLAPNPLTGSGTTLIETYCTPTVSSGYAVANYINTVNFVGNLVNTNNTSTYNNAAPIGYQDFTSLGSRATQAQNEGVNIFLDTNQANAVFMKAWVDWNKDGVFTDATEIVYQCSNAFLNTTFGFQVPGTVSPGNYRIRIRINRATVAGDLSYNNFTACGNIVNYGETEDYLFTVVQDCPAKITSISPGYTCGTGTTTLGAVGTAGTTEYRWYTLPSGGSYTATTATTWTTPSISATTTFYVTAYNGSCESLFRTPVIATVKPVASLTFSNSNPNVCGENSIIDLSASGTNEQVYLIDENFESGLGVFTSAVYGTQNNVLTNWSVKTSTYVPSFPTYPVWYPAISSGFGTNKFALTTSDISAGGNTFGKIDNAIESVSINTVGFLNLTLTFNMYFSSYYDNNSASTELVVVEYKNGAGPWTLIPGGQYLNDEGIGTQFVFKSLNMNAMTGIANLQVRVRYKAGWCDGVAIDNVKLFGDRPLVPNITWTSALPVDAYTNAACTIPYVAGTPVSSVWVKPTLAQLEQGTYSFTANANLTNGCTISGTINVTNQSKVWKGTTSNDWNVASNWLPAVVPDANTCVIIPTGTNSKIINTPNAVAKNVTVKAPTGNLELQASQNLTVTDWINVESGATFNVRNSANLVQINNAAINTGSINMDRTAIGLHAKDYILWSSPVENFGITNVSPLTSTSRIYHWTPDYFNGTGFGYGNWFNVNENMVAGKGYAVRVPNSNPTFSTTFTGKPQNGVITKGIVRGPYVGGTYTGTNSNITTYDDNWNLVGNPYPSAIDAIDFLNANNTILMGEVSLWTHSTPIAISPSPYYQTFVYNYTSNDYVTYNNLGDNIGPTSGFNGKIAAGQAFFVKMIDGAAGTGTITFNNSLRSSAHNNGQFYKTSGSETTPVETEKHRIWLDLVDSNLNTSRVMFGYTNGATNQKDHMFDATTNYTESLKAFTTIDNNDDIFVIQGKGLPFETKDKINFGIQVPANGTYKIAISDTDGLFKTAGQKIYVEDLLNNITHDLTTSPYSFTSEKGTFKNRFIIKYENQTLSNDDSEFANSVMVFGKQQLTVKSELFTIKNISVYDLLGKTLIDLNNVNTKEYGLMSLKNTNNALLVKVTLDNGAVVTKKVIF